MGARQTSITCITSLPPLAGVPAKSGVKALGCTIESWLLSRREVSGRQADASGTQAAATGPFKEAKLLVPCTAQRVCKQDSRASRSARYPGGKMAFSLWKAGCSHSTSPSATTAKHGMHSRYSTEMCNTLLQASRPAMMRARNAAQRLRKARGGNTIHAPRTCERLVQLHRQPQRPAAALCICCPAGLGLRLALLGGGLGCRLWLRLLLLLLVCSMPVEEIYQAACSSQSLHPNSSPAANPGPCTKPKR